MTRPDTTTLRAFADLIGCKPSYVTDLRKAGRLVMTDDDKRVRVAESIALIESTRDPARVGVAARHAAQRGEVLASAADADTDDAGAEAFVDTATTSDARRRAKALADKAEADAAAAIRENLIADGKLYDADDADSAIAACVTTFRKALERLPDVIAPQVCVLDNEARIREVLAAEIENAQRELARTFGRIGGRAA